MPIPFSSKIYLDDLLDDLITVNYSVAVNNPWPWVHGLNFFVIVFRTVSTFNLSESFLWLSS